MSNRDNPANRSQEIRELYRRLRDLETATPLSNASISSGGIRVLTPGGEGGSTGGDEVVLIGHAQGKSGFLVKDGGQWVTVKEYADGKIAASHEYPNARLDAIDAWRNANGPTINSHGTRITGLEGRMSNAETSLNGKASVSSVTTAQSRADSAWNLANGKASVSYVDNAVSDKVSTSHFTVLQGQVGTISQALTNLRNYVYSIHGSPQD